jgi:hypothetical protein
MRAGANANAARVANANHRFEAAPITLRPRAPQQTHYPHVSCPRSSRTRGLCAMKIITSTRLLILMAILAIVGIGYWLDRHDVPFREGEVVIDEAFLQHLETDDYRTTHDPAIKYLLRHQSATLRDDLRKGYIKILLRRFRSEEVTVRVTVRKPVGEEWQEYTSLLNYTRYRRKTWDWFSPSWWQEEVLHCPYWSSPWAAEPP